MDEVGVLQVRSWGDAESLFYYTSATTKRAKNLCELRDGRTYADDTFYVESVSPGDNFQGLTVNFRTATDEDISQFLSNWHARIPLCKWVDMVLKYNPSLRRREKIRLLNTVQKLQ